MYEQGVIRPPSEAFSLLVRVTRNCPWNRCLICPAYKGATFSKRDVQEVKNDIDSMAEAHGSHSEMIRSAFLQDADSLIISTAELIQIISHLKHRFPNVTRITSYARAKTLKRKSMNAYNELREAGLTRIHTGMESGSLNVLKMIRKGAKPEDIVIGGLRVKETGISLSEYVMPGVGGKALSTEHALETARLLNIIKPDYIRVRTFAMHPHSPMQKMVEEGSFIPMTDGEVVKEIRLLVAALERMPAYFTCGDFSLNLLMHINGSLDRQKDQMLEDMDRFLSLPKSQQQAYSLLQRTYPASGRPIDRIRDDKALGRLTAEIQRLEKSEKDGFNRHIRVLMSHQLPQLQTGSWT
jgi:radical SAM superfamily enzyme